MPYPIFTYSALLPWTYFACAVGLASTSLVSNRGLVTKVYFPRILLPLAGVTVPIVDFFLAFVVLVGMMVWFQVWPSCGASSSRRSSSRMAFLTALGVGLFLSALNVRYRDVPYAIPFLIQIWLFLSGVVYAINALPEKWQWVLALNPMTAVISGFQWGVLGTAAPELGQDARQRRRDRRVRRGRALVLPALRAALRGHDLMTPAIATEGLSKQLPDRRAPERLRNAPRLARGCGAPSSCVASTAAHYEEIWALRDVSFEVPEGAGPRHHRAGTAPASPRC